MVDMHKLNNFLITLNGLIAIVSCFKIGKCLVISFVTQTHLETRSVRYEMTQEKKRYETAVRIFLLLMLLSNLIILSWSISRIINNWQPYSNFWIAFTSLAFSIIMLLKSHILLMVFRGDELKHF